MHNYQLTRISANTKTGPIPVSMTSKDSCPDTCALKANGCYAEAGNVNIHWVNLTKGKTGTDLNTFLGKIRKLPRKQLWRHNQAGDLPQVGGQIDNSTLKALSEANKGKRGFTYTHHLPTKENVEAVKTANEAGFTVNWSADNLEQADERAALNAGPVVCILPEGTTKPLQTPQGRFVAVCPATQRDDVTCATCGICAMPDRKAIIGFPAHGAQKKKAERVFFNLGVSK